MNVFPLPKPDTTTIGETQVRWGERTLVMGVINTTADSFSGDGLDYQVDAAVAQGLRFVEEGADILDVGGESTRPTYSANVETCLRGVSSKAGSRVTEEDELRRIIPVIEQLAKITTVPISVDTYKHAVARHALESGASLLNDVWGAEIDSNLATIAAEYGVPIVLMHNQLGTYYDGDIVDIVVATLAQIRDAAVDTGVPRENIILDPGFGFGKTVEGNLEILRRLDDFRCLGQPLLLGTSRKSTIGMVLNTPTQERLEGTAATTAIGIARGVDIVRVHDVRFMARVARMSDSISRK